MSITAQHLSILISQGESDRIEFKTKIINQNEIVKVLTAFANTEGGYLIIGVEDKGNIVGLTEEEASQTEKRLSSICKSLFPYGVNIGVVVVDGKNLVYTKIEKAPSYLIPITTGTGEYFVRNKESITRMSLSSLASKFNEKKSTDKEIIGFVAMSFRDEEEPVLIDYFQAMLRAVNKTGLPIKLNRIDLKDGDFEISQQLMDEIDNSDFVLSDYTLNPHNVYFEAGYARGAKKRIIQTARKGVVLQFDVRNWSTLFYRNATELEEKLAPKFEALYRELTTK